MQRYGQPEITWSTMTAPHPATGICTGYRYRERKARALDPDGRGVNRALSLHSAKAEMEFSAKVTAGSTDFLDLSRGGGLLVSGIDSGLVLVRRAVERWTLIEPKTISISGTHYPAIQRFGAQLAGTSLSAFTPAQTGLDSTVFPGGNMIWSTVGLGHASGVLHMLEISQELEVNEDQPTPDGHILAAISHGYVRTITAHVLSKADPPKLESVLAITGAPAHAANYRVEDVDTIFAHLRAKMYELRAVWIPPFN